MENGILGFQPWAVLFFFVILFMAFIIYSGGKKAEKKKEKYFKKMVVEFFTNTGVHYYLCEEEYGEIILPEKFKGKENTISGFVSLPGSKPSEDGKPQLDRYYIQPQFKFDVYWPPERPAKDQVSIKMTSYIEGICLPIVGVSADLWTSEMLSTLASDLIGLSSDKDTMRTFNAQDSGFWNNIEWIRKKIMKIDSMQIACFVAAGGVAVMVFVIMQLSSKVDSLLGLFIGK